MKSNLVKSFSLLSNALLTRLAHIMSMDLSILKKKDKSFPYKKYHKEENPFLQSEAFILVGGKGNILQTFNYKILRFYL